MSGMNKKHMRNRWKAILVAIVCLIAVIGVVGCNKKSAVEPADELVIVDQPLTTQEQTEPETPLEEDSSQAQPDEILQAEAEPLEEEMQEQPTTEQLPEEALQPEQPDDLMTEEQLAKLLDPDGTYTSKEDVALYIHLYGELPPNFITKKEAQNLGWSGGSLEKYAPGKCIGGSRFGNYEGLLPEADGRSYHECDIDTLGKKSRGAKRIVYSNDGLIYYTDDHYETFELLYGEE